KARLPFDVRLDAVTVTDVDRGFAGKTLNGTMQGRDTPFRHRLPVDIESRLVELDHIYPDCRELMRLGVEQLGKRHRQPDLVAIIGVGDRVDDRHRSGQREFQSPFGVRASDLGLDSMDAAFALQPTGDGRHQRFIAVVADAHRYPTVKIDTL